MENFLYQLNKYYQFKNTLTDESNVEEFVFDIKKIKKLLGGLIGFIPAEHGKNTTSK
jgi:hypothetical protein